MSTSKPKASHATLYVIVIGTLILVIANILVSYLSDNIWRNLAIGVLLSLLTAVIVYFVAKNDKNLD